MGEEATGSSQLLAGHNGDEVVLVVQEWVEGLAICLLNSAAEAIGCCKEVVEATNEVHQWAGVGTACLPGEKSMSLQNYMTLRIGVTRRCRGRMWISVQDRQVFLTDPSFFLSISGLSPFC